MRLNGNELCELCPTRYKGLFLILHDVAEHEESVTVKCETIATLVPWS